MEMVLTDASLVRFCNIYGKHAKQQLQMSYYFGR